MAEHIVDLDFANDTGDASANSKVIVEPAGDASADSKVLAEPVGVANHNMSVTIPAPATHGRQLDDADDDADVDAHAR